MSPINNNQGLPLINQPPCQGPCIYGGFRKDLARYLPTLWGGRLINQMLALIYIEWWIWFDDLKKSWHFSQFSGHPGNHPILIHFFGVNPMASLGGVHHLPRLPLLIARSELQGVWIWDGPRISLHGSAGVLRMNWKFPFQSMFSMFSWERMYIVYIYKYIYGYIIYPLVIRHGLLQDPLLI